MGFIAAAWLNNKARGSRSELELSSDPAFWTCDWRMLVVVGSAEEHRQDTHRLASIVCERTQQNRKSETAWEALFLGCGTLASWDFKEMWQSEAPWGCQAGAPPTPHNRTPRCFEEMPWAAGGKFKEGRLPPFGGHWAWHLSFKKLSKVQLPRALWGQHSSQHYLWKLVWKLFSKKHSPSSFLSAHAIYF